MIQTILWEMDVTEVKRISVGSGSGLDKLIWHYTPKDEYTVKSGYFTAQHIDESFSNGLSSGLSSGLKLL